MFHAQLLKSGSNVYGPWIERKGDNLIARADAVDLAVGATLTVRLFTKNIEDTGNGDEVWSGTTIQLTSPGRGVARWLSNSGIGIKELVRYKFEPSSGWALFRMLDPVWYDSVGA